MVQLIVSSIALVISLVTLWNVMDMKYKVEIILHRIYKKFNPPQEMTEEEYEELCREYYRKKNQ